MKPILTITGSDSTGGAGIQADIRTISGMGAVAMSVVTSITLQNSLGIQEFYDIPAPVVERQIDAVVDDAHPQVVKIGMVRDKASLSAIVNALKRHQPKWVLFSPVVSSTHEERLMSDELIELAQKELLPLCSLMVVRKRDAHRFVAERMIQAADNHGRCNEICSAIAVYLNQDATMDEAVRKASMLIPQQDVVPEEIPPRIVSLYRDFFAMQEDLCSHCHDVNFYAGRLGVSPRYLSQVTRRMADQTPKGIIEATLLSHIKNMLEDNATMSFLEIAGLLGFSSQSHLSTFFKRLTGITPTDYRNNSLKHK